MPNTIGVSMNDCLMICMQTVESELPELGDDFWDSGPDVIPDWVKEVQLFQVHPLWWLLVYVHVEQVLYVTDDKCCLSDFPDNPCSNGTLCRQHRFAVSQLQTQFFLQNLKKFNEHR